MKRIIAYTLLTLLAFSAKAQTDVALEPEYGGRLSAELERKVGRGLHVGIEEEVRLADGFGSLGRLQTTLHATYKPLPYLKVGAGYAMINPYSAANKAFKATRHRLMFDATGTYKTGRLTLSLKERLQFTYRTGSFNQYQQQATAITLKSRLKVLYRLSPKLAPYAYIEVRHMLNAPTVVAGIDAEGHYVTLDNGYQTGEPGWFLSGDKSAYLNRIRGSIGMNYKFNKQHTATLYLLADRVSDKVIDANAAGTRLKSYTRQVGFVGQIGLAYTFAF